MDCKTAQMLIDFARPSANELDAVEAQAFQAHLDECPVCEGYAGQELEMNEHLGKAMCAVELPPGLKDRLLGTLRKESNAVRWRRLIRYSSAAAAVILVSFIIYLGLRPDESTEVVQVPNEGYYDLAPLGPLDELARPEAIEEWFNSRHGIAVKLPKELTDKWDFHFLKEKSVATHDGSLIPVLEFSTENATAKVFLLRNGQFGPNRLPDLGQGAAKSHHILGASEAGEHFAVVVILKGDEKEFHKPESRLVA